MSLHDMSGKQAVFFERIMGLPVFDTHTHLIGDRLGARDFWEIAHYFWFYRELQAGDTRMKRINYRRRSELPLF